MKLLYFAWIKTEVGTHAEEKSPPAEVTTVAQLIDWLVASGENYARAFADREALKVAVNQSFAKEDSRIAPGDEVAFFPPVTGG